MKKKNVLNLIKYYAEHNDSGFRNEAYQIADSFYNAGDRELAEYIIAVLSGVNTFAPQEAQDGKTYTFLRKIEYSKEPLPLPDCIKEDIDGVINAINYDAGINKFLFQGAPGTGKTETAKQIARILNRIIYRVDFETIIDSKLGQTSKNIIELFEEINYLSNPYNAIILFDEIDALVMNRMNSNDMREMGRATSSFLKGFDELNEHVIVIATTNLYKEFDKALIRRFDSVIDFNRYSGDDLENIAVILLDYYLPKFPYAERNVRLFRKIIRLMDPIPCPGDMKNMIRTALAFGNPSNPYSYLVKLYLNTNNPNLNNINYLKEEGFTVREIEALTGVSRSQVTRRLRGE